MTVSSVYSKAEPDAIIGELVGGLGSTDPALVVFFASPSYDGALISSNLKAQWPGANVLGCTTAGEFSDSRDDIGGVSAIAIPQSKVDGNAVALVKFDSGVESGVNGGLSKLETALGLSLRELDATKSFGFVLIDGLHGNEEKVNASLGEAAPLLSFVGGSAGDDLAFERTQVFLNGESVDNGCVLAVLNLNVPFTVVKTCSFKPTDHSFTITKADVENRVVYELNGRPVLEVYAEAAGCSESELDASVFMKHPLGIMIGDEPWIRSPQAPTDDEALKFYCQILPGMEVHLMESTDLIAESRSAFAEAAERVGGSVSGAVLFSCILRRLEMDADNLHDEWVSLMNVPTAGFHTYGESWLGHINQTCTGVLIG